VPYTEQQHVEFRQQFAVRRRRQIILAIPVVLVMIVALLIRMNVDVGAYGLSPAVIGPAFLVLVAAALIFSFANWRCPACNGYLGRGINPKFCSKCGMELS